ncbi:BMP family ABC transporter substrate-binding protein [Frisingicoccus caecimuris]|uniref:Nucleoside-binding protein n=1 Tax=Frisingicoccus caecimuris TaxID=1796636 RepID=A0A4R2LG74_9FIRM|nr:BMP family ABC transporter substrate-binding protein [Frisingicoccus caecimuris]MCR1918409.1 BMP family ABC transporter substrate-binding protein [Frisingicoccus caecimuris]TCO85055.1 nucleoside-binding protein [Frisingicoccus caecimuris]
MKLRKFLALALAVTTVLSMSVLTGCSSNSGSSSEKSAETTETGETAGETKGEATNLKDIKIGFIFLHDENSTYDKNFIDAANAAKEALGLSDEQVIFKTNIPESSECYEAAADLADRGCNIVFADSFGHEQYIAQAAAEFPDVQFCHATGTTAHTAGLDNFHNAFASIYEGRYLAGIAAGMKLNEMIADGEFTEDEAKIGYVGAYTYAEVISGYTSFYLGAKSVCPSVTMEVQFTGSWYDETAEKEAANTLISRDCKLISQHADSMGAPTACESAGVPNVSYNGSTVSACPNTFIVSSKIDWAPYFEYIVNCVANGEAIDADWCKGIAEGSVVLTDLNDAAAAEGTAEAIAEAEEKLVSGDLHVFDTTTFTVDGAALDSYMADVDTDADYTPDTEVISDGYFHESEMRSAPYFDLRIDGITTLNEMF